SLVLPAALSADLTAIRAPQVLLSPQSMAIPLDGTLALQVRLSNPETDEVSELVVYRHMWTGIVLIARTVEGTELRPEGMTHYHQLCPPPPPREGDFIRLDAGQFLGETFQLTPSDLGIKAPGTYSVYAQYWISVLAEGPE